MGDYLKHKLNIFITLWSHIIMSVITMSTVFNPNLTRETKMIIFSYYVTHAVRS